MTDKEEYEDLPDWIKEPFEQGLKDFVRSIRQENAKSNRRLYKILEPIKGKSFVDSVKNLLKSQDGLPQIRIARKPLGVCLKDNRWSAIPELWIDQRQSTDGSTGYLYVQVKDNRWLKIHF